MMSSPTDVPGTTIGVLFRRPAQAVQRHITRRLQETGRGELSEAHMAVFIHVRREGSRLTDLAERAQITKQSMGYLVDNLEALGFVERASDPLDRRAKLIQPTPAGLKVLDDARLFAVELEGDWSRRLGARRFRTLRQLLTELGGRL